MVNGSCLICNSDAISFQHQDYHNRFEIVCPLCGRYKITKGAVEIFDEYQDELKSSFISNWLIRHKSTDEGFIIGTELINKLLSEIVPLKPKEQADRLLLWIGDEMKKPGNYLTVKYFSLQPTIVAYDIKNVKYIFEYLKGIGYIKTTGQIQALTDDPKQYQKEKVDVLLTIDGWEQYEKLKSLNIVSRTAFMAMQYGNEVLDRILRVVIKPSVSQTGFEIRRLDENPQAGLIDDRMRVEIRRSKFLVADLTHGNKGAYWEAGFAEGIGIPVIYICEKSIFDDKDNKPHFDTNHHLTVVWEDTEEGRAKFSNDLKNTIRATFPTEAKQVD